jgi:alcohol/geraniol dehydrogenase (NADP+)
VLVRAFGDQHYRRADLPAGSVDRGFTDLGSSLMVPSTVVGFAARAAGNELEPFTYDTPDLGDGEIRVAVTHCGVCHTDVHAIDNDFGVFSFPLVPGHEIVGRVSELGAGVVGFEVDDRVGIGWQGRCCDECEWCRRGEEHLCQEIADCGTWTPYGGFSSSVVVDARFAYRLPPDMAPEVAAVLMCAGITVFSPLRREADGSCDKVGIVGVGGIGHLAIQFAHALGFDVTALSSSPGKEEMARTLGADHFILTTDPAAMQRAEYGFDLLVCTAPVGNDWAGLLMALKKNGRLVLPAFAPVELALATSGSESGAIVDLVVHQLSITGSFLGNRRTMTEMLDFAQEHQIAPLVELMPMSQVNEALRKVRQNVPRYRIVLVAE